MATYMLKKEGAGDTKSLVNRAVNAAIDAQAEYVYFDLMQHFLIIRVRWGSRMRMLWRGPRTPEIMTHLKASSGMDASNQDAKQEGKFPFSCRDQTQDIPVVYVKDSIYMRIVLDLMGLLAEKQEPNTDTHG